MVKLCKNPVFISSVILCFLLYSKLLPVAERKPFLSPIPSESIMFLEGRVNSNPVKTKFFGTSYKITLNAVRAKSENAAASSKGNVTVFIPAGIVESLYPGKLYTSSPNLTSPLIENGIKISCTVKYINGKNLKNCFLASSVTETEKPSALVKFRSLSRLQFKRLMYSWKEAGGLLLALVSGSREYTADNVSAGFRNAGLSHILALSGMHLSLFGGIAFFLGKKFTTRRIASVIQFSAVVFFVWFAGLSPSLFRAFLSSLIIFTASFLKLGRADSLSVLSLTFFIHIIIFPGHIFDAGFMLSYSSLLGILLLSKCAAGFLPSVFPCRIRSALAESLSAQLAVAPVCLKLFGKIMPAGIIAGVVVSPFIVLFLYTGLLGIVLCLFLPFLSGPISDIMSIIYKVIRHLVLFFSGNSAFS